MRPHRRLTVAIAIAISFAAGCTKEEPKSSAPATTPSATPAQPPNPPSVTGVSPAPPAAPEGPGPAERAGRVIGEQLDEAAVTAKVKAALLHAPDVKGMDVNVETQRGVVQLSGFIETQTQMERAMEIARGVSGVKEVHNKMSLKSGK